MSDNPSLSLFWYLSFPDLAVEAASYFGIYPCRALSTSWFFALNRCFRIILHFFSPDLDSDCSSSSPASFPWRMVFRSPDMGNECAHCSCHIDATSHRKNVYLCVCILTCVYIYTHTHVYIHTHTHTHTHTRASLRGFPRGSDGKESAYNAGSTVLILGLNRSPGDGNGNSLQYSCLENPMNRGACWATVHGVTKSWTRLSD